MESSFESLKKAVNGARKAEINLWLLPSGVPFELGRHLMRVIIPEKEAESISVPVTFEEWEFLFVEAEMYYNSEGPAYVVYPFVDVVTQDAVKIRVSFGETLTCEISDEFPANDGS